MKGLSAVFVRRLIGLFEAGVFVGILCVGLGFLGRLHWTLDLFSHFRIQYTITLAFAGVMFFLLKRRRASLACAVVALLLAATFVKYYLPAPVEGGGETFKIVSYNVHTGNERHGDVIRFLMDEDPDFVFLMEVNAEWVRELGALQERFPHRVGASREDNFGVLLLSKHPIASGGIAEFGDIGLPSVEVVVPLGGREVRFIGTHPLPPVSLRGSRERNAQLRDLEEHVAGADFARLIVAGDFNTTPFSHYFRRFVKETGLKDSSLGFGMGPTWLREVPWFAIPIDHVLVSSDLGVRSRRIGPRLGSDHNPVIVELSLGELSILP